MGIKISYINIASHLLSAAVGRDLFDLPGQVSVPNIDHDLHDSSLARNDSHVRPAAQEGHGPHERVSLDSHGARAMGQSNIITSLGAWGRHSAAQWEGLM